MAIPLMTDNKKSKRLTDKQRLEILDLLENDPSVTKVELGRRYGISGSAITKLHHNAEVIRSRHADGSIALRDNRQRGTKAIAQPFEEKLYRWLYALESHRLSVSPAQVMEKAELLSAHEAVPNFAASNGWYYRFLNRYGFKTSATIKHELTAITPDVMMDQLRSLRVKLASFGPEQVYCMDIAELFYRFIPHYDALCPFYAQELMSQDELSPKDRVSLLVCANATGSHKLPLLLADKTKGMSSLPPCFQKQKSFPVPYTTYGKAWCVDTNVFKHWFDTVFFPTVRERTPRPVVLLLENSSGQFHEITRDNVTTILLPPHTPIMYQPMEQGIVSALKCKYKFGVLSDILSFREKPQIEQQECVERAKQKTTRATGIALGRPPHLLDAMQMLKEAWDEITPSAIRHAWKRTTLIPDTVCEPLQPVQTFERESDILDEMVQTFPRDCIDAFVDIRTDLKSWLYADASDSTALKESIMEELDGMLLRSELIEIADKTIVPTTEPWAGAQAILKALSTLESLYEHHACKEYLGEALVSEHLQQIEMQRRVIQRAKSMKDRKRRRDVNENIDLR
ncbi:hypothetical protein THRCLA_21557 [Thraustotheca clavata]|uniref:HTH CENPB-type domain-containing protein n=1 Tax=Thraustotheca clavata TaxID=74557 RepID=A0A1V9ZVE4_9STRA|nr:hypothetical protein THRCLA_21557 [Thraustotheca clavata]